MSAETRVADLVQKLRVDEPIEHNERLEAAVMVERLFLGLNNIVNFQSPLTKSQVREAAAEALRFAGQEPLQTAEDMSLHAQAIQSARIQGHREGMEAAAKIADAEAQALLKDVRGRLKWMGSFPEAYVRQLADCIEALSTSQPTPKD